MTLPPAHRALYTDYLSIIHISVYLFINLLSSYLSIHLSLHPSIYLFVCLTISQNGKLRDICQDIWHVSTNGSQCRSVQPDFIVVSDRSKTPWCNISIVARMLSFCHRATARFQFISWQSRTWYFGDDFGCFWSIQTTFVVGEQLCDVRTPSWALTTLLRAI